MGLELLLEIRGRCRVKGSPWRACMLTVSDLAGGERGSTQK